MRRCVAKREQAKDLETHKAEPRAETQEDFSLADQSDCVLLKNIENWYCWNECRNCAVHELI